MSVGPPTASPVVSGGSPEASEGLQRALSGPRTGSEACRFVGGRPGLGSGGSTGPDGARFEGLKRPIGALVDGLYPYR